MIYSCLTVKWKMFEVVQNFHYLRLQIYEKRCKVQGEGFRVQGARFRVQGAGLRVRGLKV